MLVGRVGLSPVMVGRAAELDRLTRLLGSGASDVPTVALVGGEAGVGKTRLVRELLQRVPAGVPVLAGQADPGALSRPFELLLHALEGADVDSADLAVIADRQRPLDERVSLGLELVRTVAGGRPTLVVLEDLHWADSESLALFERLAEPDLGPLVIVGTYRPDAVHRRHPVGELLPRLERRHSVTHIRLGRLDPLAVGAFLTAVYGRSPSFRVVEALHTRTGGNPFFLEELLAASGDADVEHLCDQPLPWSLAEVVHRQLDELDSSERRIIEAAAVLGQRVSFDLLATVTRTGEDALIDVLRDLVARGLLVEPESDLFSFRHALFREAIENELLGRERRRLHRAALDALKDTTSTDLAAVAHHAAGAGRVDDLVTAARKGSQDYLEQGSTYQALQLAELGLAEADDDLRLLAIAARAAWLSGLVDDAIAHSTQRLEVARRLGDVEEISAALRLQVRLWWEHGDFDAMAACTDEVIALVDQLAVGEERGRAVAVVAQSYMLRDKVDDAISWADRAITEAEALGNDGVRAAALVEKGSAMVMVPELADAGSELLFEAADLGERLGDDIVVARALHNLVRTDARPRDADVARQLLARMRDAAERVGFDSMAGAAHAQGLADLAEWEGDLDGARAALQEGRMRDRGYLTTAKGSWYQVHEAGLALEAGDIERAAELCASLRMSVGEKAQWFTGLAMHVAARTGDLVTARVELARLIESAPAGAGLLDAHLVHDVVSAALRAGMTPAELQPLVERVRRTDGSTANLQGLGEAGAAMLDAQLAEAEGRYDDAVAGFELALAADLTLAPALLGTAHVAAARSLLALGRVDEARPHAESAIIQLGAWQGWRVEELDAVRRRLGMGAGVPGPDALTPREREVVALLAEGLSNADLAARLFISPKTAAVHVSNVLAKLGMASRTEVAAWAVREDVARQTSDA